MSASPPPPTGAVRLGSVMGVPVYLDRTWLLLAAFIAWSGWSSGRSFGTGTAIAYAAWLVLAILIAVLSHEAAHAVSARLLGFRVHRIVATLWGGHTAYDGTGTTPGRHAAVALSGPAINVVLAVVGYAAAETLPYPASEFAWSFFMMNVLLAVFNLLPGLPLDGGAAVQALVWSLSGRRDLGLTVAGWVGRVVAVGVVLVFAVRPVISGDPDPLSLVLSLVMAWILWAGATAAIRRAPLERLVATIRVCDLVEPAALVPPSTPVGQVAASEAVILSPDERGRPALVLPRGGDDGVDLRTVPSATPVSSLLVRLPEESVVDLAPGADAEQVIRAMAASARGLVVVTDQGALRGVVTAARLDAAARGALGHT
ncbi:MAG: site-2 protease family protein [Dermatophilaceae bacterium]